MKTIKASTARTACNWCMNPSTGKATVGDGTDTSQRTATLGARRHIATNACTGRPPPQVMPTERPQPKPCEGCGKPTYSYRLCFPCFQQWRKERTR